MTCHWENERFWGRRASCTEVMYLLSISSWKRGACACAVVWWLSLNAAACCSFPQSTQRPLCDGGRTGRAGISHLRLLLSPGGTGVLMCFGGCAQGLLWIHSNMCVPSLVPTGQASLSFLCSGAICCCLALGPVWEMQNWGCSFGRVGTSTLVQHPVFVSMSRAAASVLPLGDADQ